MRAIHKSAVVVYPTATWSGRLRMLPLWVWLVSYVWAPLYELFWRYVLNFRGRFLYLFSDYTKFHDEELEKSATKILPNDPHYVEFAKFLRANIPQDVIDQERARLLRGNDETDYHTGLFKYLDQDTRAAILKFALSPEVLKYVLTYMKVVPKISVPAVHLNVARTDLPEGGSKKWHRDSFNYKTIKIFMYLSDVDDSAGPNFVLGQDSAPLHAEIPKAVIDYTVSEWNTLRLSDEELFAYVDESKVVKLTGNIGATSLQDAAVCYHKGGDCTQKDRLVLQIEFATDDGTGAVPKVSDWVDLSHPDLAPLLRDRVSQFIITNGKGLSSLLRRLRVYGLLRGLYYRQIFYYMKPIHTRDKG